jgi:hypothetical protein
MGDDLSQVNNKSRPLGKELNKIFCGLLCMSKTAWRNVQPMVGVLGTGGKEPNEADWGS